MLMIMICYVMSGLMYVLVYILGKQLTDSQKA